MMAESKQYRIAQYENRHLQIFMKILGVSEGGGGGWSQEKMIYHTLIQSCKLKCSPCRKI
jgi:hypothetical protein